MPLEVGGALRSRLEAPAFAKATARQGGRREDFRLQIFQAGKEEGNETPEKNNEMESKECCVLSLDFKLRSAGFRPLLHFAQPIQHV